MESGRPVLLHGGCVERPPPVDQGFELLQPEVLLNATAVLPKAGSEVCSVH